MNGFLQVLSGFMKKEFSQTLRDPVMRVFLIVVPVIQLTLFGYAISNEFKNIRIAFIGKPGDSSARQLTESFYASGWFLSPKPFKETDPEKILRSGKADVVMIFPKEGLEKALESGTEKIQLLIDAQNATKARSVEMYCQNLLRTFLEKNYFKGERPPSLQFQVRVLYNPTLETSMFMVPGVMAMIVCLVTVLLTCMSLAREKEIGTFETLIASPLSKLEILLGKTIPYVILGMMNCMLVIAAGMLIFDVPIRGSLGMLLLSSLIYVCTTLGVGMLISTIAQNQQQAMMGAFLFIFPALLLSGILFPIENMPDVLRSFAYLDPLTYYVKIIRNIMLKGANPDLVFMQLSALLCLMLFILALTVNRFRQTMN